MAQKAQSGYVGDGGNSDRQHGHVGHKREPPPFQEWREIVQSETSAIDEKFEYACDDHTKSR